jgi:hypothetical protein
MIIPDFMPRTMGALGIRAWRAEQLIRDLALGEKSHINLAEEHDVELQTIAAFKLRHRDAIDAQLADWTSFLDQIWSTRLENRLRVLTQRLEEIEDQLDLLRDHARRETEMIRNVDPEASEVLVNGPEYRAYEKEQRALIREIADQTGQLPQRVGKVEVDVKNPLTFGGSIAQDEAGNWYSVQP